VKEDFNFLFEQLIEGKVLSRNSLEVFKINRVQKVYEFRYQDDLGNWRVIATGIKRDSFILVYAFHKKSRALLVKVIRSYCEENSVSQKKLASLVPGLTQYRVSKIFTGQVGHMTIDKMILILSVLKLILK